MRVGWSERLLVAILMRKMSVVEMAVVVVVVVGMRVVVKTSLVLDMIVKVGGKEIVVIPRRGRRGREGMVRREVLWVELGRRGSESVGVGWRSRNGSRRRRRDEPI